MDSVSSAKKYDSTNLRSLQTIQAVCACSMVAGQGSVAYVSHCQQCSCLRMSLIHQFAMEEDCSCIAATLVKMKLLLNAVNKHYAIMNGCK